MLRKFKGKKKLTIIHLAEISFFWGITLLSINMFCDFQETRVFVIFNILMGQI